MAETTVWPVDEARWPDLEEVFGANGGCEGCWCMFWRLTGREYERLRGEPARRRLRDRVDGEPAPGLIAYVEGLPAGWCAVAPRQEYSRVLRSRTLRPAEPTEADVWAVPCFYVHRRYRRAGLTADLLAAAVDFVAEHGGQAVEGYPMDPTYRRYPASDLYTGTVGLFARHGFTERHRPSSGRVVMRREVG